MTTFLLALLVLLPSYFVLFYFIHTFFILIYFYLKKNWALPPDKQQYYLIADHITMLNIGFRNIQGLCSKTFGLKSTNTDFLNSITNVDMLILTETWCRSDVSTQCPASYSEIIVSSWKLNSIHRGRDSGGLVVWIKNDLAPFTSPVQQAKNHIWFKLDKSFGILYKDLFICGLYIPPSDSPYYHDEVFDTLQEEINRYQTLGKIILCGDSRSQLDFIDNSGDTHLFTHLPQDLFSTLPRRNNQDTGVNRHGKEVAHLCQTLGLYILNGRIKGDSCGQFTYSSNLGNSVVDYAISNISPSHFSALTVQAQSPLPDQSIH